MRRCSQAAAAVASRPLLRAAQGAIRIARSTVCAPTSRLATARCCFGATQRCSLRRFSSSASVAPPQPGSAVPPLHAHTAPVDASTGDEIRALLAPHFALERLSFVAAYGSAAFQQLHEDEAAAADTAAANSPPPPPQPLSEEPMLDLLFSVADPLAFHAENVARNPSHYSFLRFAPRWILQRVQEYGAGVWYNTLVRLPVPGFPQETKLVKYGVISNERLLRDLQRWESLYLAGRMHKPMHLLQCSDEICSASEQNLSHAVTVSLLLLDSKPSSAAAPSSSAAAPSLHSFTTQTLFHTLTSLSYSGDIRMGLAENPHKVAKIVTGNWKDLVQLYAHIVPPLVGHKVDLHNKKAVIEFACDEGRRAQMLATIPAQVLEEIRQSDPDCWPLVQLASRPPAARHSILSRALASIVRRSSKQQTMKGLATAGVRKSMQYALAKVKKAFAAKAGK